VTQILSDSDMAQLSATAINTDRYVAAYLRDLLALLDSKTDAILDSACGIGFPSLELRRLGFANVTICDGDPSSLAFLHSRFADAGLEVRSVVSQWDTLSWLGAAQFDVVLNLGNSFVYMDGWKSDLNKYESVSASFAHITARCVHILKQFHHVLKGGGTAIIGLARHYERTTTDGVHSSPLSCTIQSGTLGGIELPLEWTGAYDWSRRTHLWKTRVASGDYEGTAVRMAYLFTKEELAGFMQLAGFRHVRIVETHHARDNFIVGVK
jgi:SAM-dependent methyltransferase